MLLSAAAWALLVCWLAQPIARRFRLLDMPHLAGGRKRHDRPTPLVGGLAVLPPVLALLWLTDVTLDASTAIHVPMTWLTAMTGLFLTVGVLDDRVDLSARLRMVIGLLAFGLTSMLVPELTVSFLVFSAGDAIFLPPVVASILTILCLLGLLNAINMADGKNGLVIGLSIIWCLLFLAYAPTYLHVPLAALVLGLGIALRFNLQGRLFLGDGGSYGLSALVGLTAIYIYNQRFSELSAEHLLLWFSIPVLDCLRLIVRRTAQGRSPFEGDRDHLHHYIAMVLGWDNGKYLYWAMVGVPGFLSVLVPDFVLPLLGLSAALYLVAIIGLRQRMVANRVPAE
jgi:UDP-GlcNAc:undecaprenyl-phosphate GlcNAc-1-phosphate transferase